MSGKRNVRAIRRPGKFTNYGGFFVFKDGRGALCFMPSPSSPGCIDNRLPKLLYSVLLVLPVPK